MLLVRRNTQPTLSNLFDNFFNNEMLESFNYRPSFVPKTNILEEEKSYVVEMVVPGFTKADFNIEIEDNQLVVSVQRATENKEEKDGKVLFKEFEQLNFKRSFNLGNKVDTTNIEAKYENGILSINIPKAVEAIVKKSILIS